MRFLGTEQSDVIQVLFQFGPQATLIYIVLRMKFMRFVLEKMKWTRTSRPLSRMFHPPNHLHCDRPRSHVEGKPRKFLNRLWCPAAPSTLNRALLNNKIVFYVYLHKSVVTVYEFRQRPLVEVKTRLLIILQRNLINTAHSSTKTCPWTRILSYF
jgi:hypothetical protein